jgi:hypothetical protein
MKPMNFVKVTAVSICLLSFLFLTQGCLNDDLSVCGVRLSFNYTDTIGGENKFASDVRKANVYIFDAATGIFVNEYSATFEQLLDSHILPINLTPGTYDFITWGNIGDMFEKTSFVPGETTFAEARIRLSALNNIVTEYPDSMYYGAMRGIKIEAPDLVLNQEIDLQLTKNNKKINVSTKVLFDGTVVDPSSYHCSITSKNGTYKFDNIPTGEQYTYIPPDGQEQVDSVSNILHSNFIVLRELNDNSFTESRLKVASNGGTRQDGVSDGGFEHEVSLTACLEAVVAGGTTIEEVPEFDIEIIITNTNGAFSVTVREWQSGGGGGVVLY